MKDNNVVIAGDYEGSTVMGGTVMKVGKRELIYLVSANVESIELIDSEEKLSMTSFIARGLIGGALLGNLGMFYGMATAKNKVVWYLIDVKFKDGKESLIRMDQTAYNNLQAKFNNKTLNNAANKGHKTI